MLASQTEEAELLDDETKEMTYSCASAMRDNVRPCFQSFECTRQKTSLAGDKILKSGAKMKHSLTVECSEAWPLNHLHVISNKIRGITVYWPDRKTLYDAIDYILLINIFDLYTKFQKDDVLFFIYIPYVLRKTSLQFFSLSLWSLNCISSTVTSFFLK